MKILVLGGTGAMGIHLIKLLVNNGVEVFVTTRRQVMSHGAIRYIQGNARNLDFLKGLLSEHWDAIVDFMSYSTEEFRNRVSLLLNVTEQYLFLSSSRVYANSEIPIREDLEAKKDKFTGESTPLSEILSIRSKLKYTLVRWFPLGEFLYELSSKGIMRYVEKIHRRKKCSNNCYVAQKAWN